jgi:asparagine synthase (glutamine-hydrolysing)
VPALAFAGRFDPRGLVGAHGAGELEAALRRDGPAESVEHAAFALAWTPPAEPASAEGGVHCLILGRPRTAGLAEELGLDPALPAQRLVASAYRRAGERVLDHLAGEFALLIWDAERARGMLARDRLGFGPLFVCESGGALLFASEVRNLLALLPAAPPPNPVAVALWLSRSTPLEARTLYSGIAPVPAASVVLLNANGWRRRRYWEPRYSPPRRIGFEEAAGEVRAAVARAVERSLDGTSRAAVMLSGGLDSAAVAAAAPDRLTAYSGVFPDDPEVDESGRIVQVRDAVGIDGVTLPFEGGSALAAGAEFIREWELPSVSPNLFVWTPLLRRAAADGIEVMLDGEGGDELFGCAPYLVADRLRAGRVPSALRAARLLPGMGEHPRTRWLRRALVIYGLRGATPHVLHARLRAVRKKGAAGPAWLGADAERLLLAHSDPWVWKRRPGPRWWGQLAHALTAVGDAIGAPDQLRRASRPAGIELRHPLRDPELVELMLGLPPELGFDPNVDRPLLRRALRGALPEERLRDDTKPVFNSLVDTSLRENDNQALRELLADPHPELASRVRSTALAAMLDRPSAHHPIKWGLDMWRLASLEMWLRHRADPSGLGNLIDEPGFKRQLSRHPESGGSVPT